MLVKGSITLKWTISLYLTSWKNSYLNQQRSMQVCKYECGRLNLGCSLFCIIALIPVSFAPLQNTGECGMKTSMWDVMVLRCSSYRSRWLMVFVHGSYTHFFMPMHEWCFAMPKEITWVELHSLKFLWKKFLFNSAFSSQDCLRMLSISELPQEACSILMQVWQRPTLIFVFILVVLLNTMLICLCCIGLNRTKWSIIYPLPSAPHTPRTHTHTHTGTQTQTHTHFLNPLCFLIVPSPYRALIPSEGKVNGNHILMILSDRLHPI